MMATLRATSVLLVPVPAPNPYAVFATDSQHHCPCYLEDEKDLTS